jgi:hypothetical protein
MTIFLEAMVGIREARDVVYWRIDPQTYGPLRTQLVGRWEAVGPFRETVVLADDDTITATLDGQQYTGIYRVVGQTLEYRLNLPQSAAVTRMTVESVSDTALALVSPFNGQRAEYTKAP